MATQHCPHGDLTLTFAGEWKVRHYELWARGNRDAAEAFGKDVSVGTMRLFGCIALCDRIEGELAGASPGDWPLEVYNWIIDTVYHDSFARALHPEKNSSSPAPITPAA
jgi:hypothetical protein